MNSSIEMQRLRCLGCGGDFPPSDGLTHPYMLSSSGCWAAYGVLLAREFQDRTYAPLHRLSVDAYAVQHPGVDGPQARNSVGIHLSKLCLVLEYDWPTGRANAAMVAITAKKFHYPWLVPPEVPARYSVQMVIEAQTATDHLAAVRLWAESVWQAWATHHPTVRQWLSQMNLST